MSFYTGSIAKNSVMSLPKVKINYIPIDYIILLSRYVNLTQHTLLLTMSQTGTIFTCIVLFIYLINLTININLYP